jgi:hypothetical protein
MKFTALLRQAVKIVLIPTECLSCHKFIFFCSGNMLFSTKHAVKFKFQPGLKVNPFCDADRHV